MKKTAKIVIHLIAVCHCVLPATAPAACQPDVLPPEALRKMSLLELMDTPVSTVSKTSEDLYSAPGIAAIISRDEIRRFGGNSLYEVLDRAASVYMGGSIFYPQNNTVMRGDQINGLDRHVLILLNGRPFRDALNGGVNYPMYTAFPLASVERLEIIRGPGSVLYGTNAYSGVINIITRVPLGNNCADGEIALRGGSFGTQAADGHAEVAGEDYHVAVGAKYFEEDGWDFRAIDRNGQDGNQRMGERNLGLTVNAGYRDWHFNLAWLEGAQDSLGIDMVWGAPTAMTQSRLLADLGYTWKLSEQQRLDVNFTYNLASSLSETITSISLEGKVDSSLLEVTHHWQHDNLSWLLGSSLEYAQDRSIRYWLPNGFNLTPKAQPPYQDTIAILYTQLDYAFSPATRLTVGGQGVKNPEQDWHFIPRLGLTHQFDQHFGAKLLYSDAYRAATQVERAINIPVIKGDPNLLPETVGTFDAQVFYRQDDQQYSLTYFRSRQQQLIVRSGPPGQTAQSFFNAGELNLQGVELEGKWSPADRWFLTGSLSYQENQDGTGTEDYTLAPNWLFKTGISYEFASGLSLGLFNTYVSQPPDNNIHNPERLLLNPQPESYNLATLNLDWPLGKALGLSENQDLALNLYVYNLWDQAVYVSEINSMNVNSVPAKAGRSAYAGIKLRF